MSVSLVALKVIANYYWLNIIVWYIKYYNIKDKLIPAELMQNFKLAKDGSLVLATVLL